MRPKPKAFFGPVILHFAPTTKFVKLDSPYNRLTKGASGKYEGATVKVTGTTIAAVCAVAGTTVQARTMPGKIPPTVEPTPGKLPAAPKLLFPPVNGPSCALNPGKPNNPLPGPRPKFGPGPPENGYCTKGCPDVSKPGVGLAGQPGWLQKGGLKTALPAIVPTFGPDGARIIAGALPSAVPLK